MAGETQKTRKSSGQLDASVAAFVPREIDTNATGPDQQPEQFQFNSPKAELLASGLQSSELQEGDHSFLHDYIKPSLPPASAIRPPITGEEIDHYFKPSEPRPKSPVPTWGPKDYQRYFKQEEYCPSNAERTALLQAQKKIDESRPQQTFSRAVGTPVHPPQKTEAKDKQSKSEDHANDKNTPVDSAADRELDDRDRSFALEREILTAQVTTIRLIPPGERNEYFQDLQPEPTNGLVHGATTPEEEEDVHQPEPTDELEHSTRTPEEQDALKEARKQRKKEKKQQAKERAKKITPDGDSSRPTSAKIPKMDELRPEAVPEPRLTPAKTLFENEPEFEHTWIGEGGFRRATHFPGIPSPYHDDVDAGRALYIDDLPPNMLNSAVLELFRDFRVIKNPVVVDIESEETFRWIVLETEPEASKVLRTMYSPGGIRLNWHTREGREIVYRIRICRSTQKTYKLSEQWPLSRFLVGFGPFHEQVDHNPSEITYYGKNWSPPGADYSGGHGYSQLVGEFYGRDMDEITGNYHFANWYPPPPPENSWVPYYGDYQQAQYAQRMANYQHGESSQQGANLYQQPSSLQQAQGIPRRATSGAIVPALPLAPIGSQRRATVGKAVVPLTKTEEKQPAIAISAGDEMPAIEKLSVDEDVAEKNVVEESAVATEAVEKQVDKGKGPAVVTSWAQMAGTIENESKTIDLKPEHKNGSRLAPPVGRPAIAPKSTSESQLSQMRVVFLMGLPSHMDLSKVSDGIHEGPLVSIRFGTNADDNTRYAGVIFQHARDAERFYQVLLKERADSRPDRYHFIVDVARGVHPLPINETTKLMQPPTNATRRLTIVKSGFFFVMREPQLRAFCEKIVGEENVQLVHLYNGGNATVIFANVENAIQVKTAFEQKVSDAAKHQSNATSHFLDLIVSFSKDPCGQTDQMRLVSDFPDGREGHPDGREGHPYRSR